jgi:hypothetical protein
VDSEQLLPPAVTHSRWLIKHGDMVSKRNQVENSNMWLAESHIMKRKKILLGGFGVRGHTM